MKKFFSIVLGMMCVLGALWLFGLLLFIHAIPDEVHDTTTVTDGIVALTGGSDRLATAVTLLKENKAQKLLITGVGEGTTLTNLALLDDISKEDITQNEEKITLGYIAKDTIQNAKETAIWASLENITSMRVVTANYHIPRAMLEFRYAMPDVVMIPHPVFPKTVTVSVSKWWHFPGSTRLIVSEYHKFMGSYLHHKMIDCLRSLSHKVMDYMKTLDKSS
jgi:uncharacterized SAM-binding protein YcdF (DUF218 family)